jgi:predicted porin
MRGLRVLGAGLLLSATVGIAGVAQAQSSPPTTVVTSGTPDQSLTWHGVTLYGIVDIGLQNQSHGAPISDYFPAGSADIVQKNSRQSVTGLTPSNMSQSRIGLQGAEPLAGDWSAVFKLETFFNPQSGQISDALKSLAQNNGKTAATSNTNLDSSVAGQAFQQSFVGFSSKTFGTVTFGRQNTVAADLIAIYDPNYASQAFSLIGLSGTTAGGGDTQNRRFDNSVKYVASYGGVAHFGAIYKFNQSTGGANTAYQFSLGGAYEGFSADAYYSKVNNAVAVAALSGAQVDDLAGLHYSISNTLAGTISDNTAYAFMGLYNFGGFLKFSAGYEHIQYANPNTPSIAGFSISGYTIGFVNNTAYPTDKTLQVFWGGVRWTVMPDLDLVAAYYGYKQNAYGIGANAGCSTDKSGTCSGTTDDVSFDADYRLTKRFDAYVGVMYTGVKDGQANGYDFHTTDITTTTGVRFKF